MNADRNESILIPNGGQRSVAMNWLAHLLLSESSAAFRVGNLLPDLMGREELTTVPAPFHAGIARHHQIDAFTDHHPVVRRSVQRFTAPHRRFAPVLIDVFYDHFLSTHWQEFSAQELPDFIAEVYVAFALVGQKLPERVASILQRMETENWLGCYVDRPGLRLTLERISLRFRRPVRLADAMEEFEKHYAALEQDFGEFFPELQASVANT